MKERVLGRTEERKFFFFFPPQKERKTKKREGGEKGGESCTHVREGRKNAESLLEGEKVEEGGGFSNVSGLSEEEWGS